MADYQQNTTQLAYGSLYARYKAFLIPSLASV